MDRQLLILDAAERRIRSAGYNGFSFREIASDVGIKSSSVHHHFPTKEALGVAVARRYTDRFFENLGKQPGAPVDRLRNAFRSAMETDGLTCLCGVLGTASLSLPLPVAAEARRFFECALRFLLPEPEAAATRREEFNWALQILSIFEGAMVLALALGDPEYFWRATKTLPQRPKASEIDATGLESSNPSPHSAT